jgi:Nucleoside-diphosphate-sugar epimerases
MTALVTGATGCLGSALVAHLRDRGDVVRALVRPGGDLSALASGVEVVTGTLEAEPEALRAAVRGIDVLYHAAAHVHDPHGAPERFDAVNVGGTRRLLDACDAAGVAPRVVFFSTVAVYGEETPPEGIPEEAPVAPATPYAASKVRAEENVREWAARRGVVPVILRVATVYGPRDRGNMARMLKAVAAGRFFLPDGGYNRKTCVAAETVARCARAAATMPPGGVPEGAVVVADPEGPYRLCDLAAAMASALGSGSAGRALPLPLLLAAGGLGEVIARVSGRRAPLTRAQVRRLAANNVYLSRRMREIIEVSDCIPLSEGMARAVSWERDATERQRRR